MYVRIFPLMPQFYQLYLTINERNYRSKPMFSGWKWMWYWTKKISSKSMFKIEGIFKTSKFEEKKNLFNVQDTDDLNIASISIVNFRWKLSLSSILERQQKFPIHYKTTRIFHRWNWINEFKNTGEEEM